MQDDIWLYEQASLTPDRWDGRYVCYWFNDHYKKYYQPLKHMRSYVYFFIIEVNKDFYVKIGTAKNIMKRLSGVQTGCPFKITPVVCIRGDRDLETTLHSIFSEKRLNGEWFYADARLVYFINHLRTHRSRVTRFDSEVIINVG